MTKTDPATEQAATDTGTKAKPGAAAPAEAPTEPSISLKTYLETERPAPGETARALLISLHREEKHPASEWRTLAQKTLSREVVG